MEKSYFDNAAQVIFADPENPGGGLCGIAYRDAIICSCCGGVLNIDEVIEMAREDGVNCAIHVYPEWVDITDEIDLKLEMLECHESQIVWMRDHDNIDFVDFVRTCSRFRGYQCGADYAEGFRTCKAYLKGTTKNLLP